MTGDWDFGNAPAGKVDSGNGRQLTQAAAVNEALRQLLAADPSVLVMGQGINDAGGMFGVSAGLHAAYGARVFDTPLAEEAMTGVGVGAALAGMRPVQLHNRPDFLLVAMNQLVNHAAKWHGFTGGRACVPLVVWACIGRGWGSGAQHTQALHGLFQQVPGLKIVLPTTPHDAKGLLIAAVHDPNPVLIIEHRWLLKQRGPVPGEPYVVPLGRGVVRRSGCDVTIVALSYMVPEALQAAEQLATEGCAAEVIDPRTLVPLDRDLILASLRRTGRLVIADHDPLAGGAAAEIAALAATEGFRFLRAPVRRVGLAPAPCPAAPALEHAFYPDAAAIAVAVRETLTCS